MSLGTSLKTFLFFWGSATKLFSSFTLPLNGLRHNLGMKHLQVLLFFALATAAITSVSSCIPAQMVSASEGENWIIRFLDWNPRTDPPSGFQFEKDRVSGEELKGFTTVKTTSKLPGQHKTDHPFYERTVTGEWLSLEVPLDSLDGTLESDLASLGFKGATVSKVVASGDDGPSVATEIPGLKKGFHAVQGFRGVIFLPPRVTALYDLTIGAGPRRLKEAGLANISQMSVQDAIKKLGQPQSIVPMQWGTWLVIWHGFEGISQLQILCELEFAMSSSPAMIYRIAVTFPKGSANPKSAFEAVNMTRASIGQKTPNHTPTQFEVLNSGVSVDKRDSAGVFWVPTDDGAQLVIDSPIIKKAGTGGGL